ncbi:hypothetical protein PPTG_20101, partial [Phytophthora nicotianae INRA-310]
FGSSSTSLPPYMTWWYAYHGRIAFDGKSWPAYFGAVFTSEGRYINIGQGDRIKVVDASGKIMASKYSTGLLRLLTPTARPSARRTATSAPDLAASNLGIVSDSRASSKKYWTPERNRNGDNAKVHLIHFALNAASGVDIILDGTGAEEYAPHLLSIGSGGA